MYCWKNDSFSENFYVCTAGKMIHTKSLFMEKQVEAGT